MHLSHADLDALTEKAKASPRQRAHQNLHPGLDAPVQRLAIAMEPDTYVRPHRHPQTWEIYIALRGHFTVLFFNEQGHVTTTQTLGGVQGLRVLEVPANTWHAVVSRESGSIIFEVKEGPYIAPGPSDLGPWSPAEGSPEVANYLGEMRNASVVKLS